MRIGIDLGGTKIEGIALDDGGQERARLRVATPAGDYEATIAAVVGLVAELERRVGTAGSVGVGIPGTLSPASGLVKNANSTWIIGRPLDRDLKAALGRPVQIANDANCFAVSEAADGAAAGAGVVFGVILGTGVGGGIVVHGRVLVGLNAIAGEWGHNPLPWPDGDELPGAACYCGQHGCIETFLSGPALARSFAEVAGRSIPAADIAALAEAGDPVADGILARYEDRLARALASVINLLDPDVIVLGGGMSNVERLYRTVPRLWQKWVFSDHTDTPLVRNRHGDSSGVRGAAWLWA
jgi:fructokinase